MSLLIYYVQFVRVIGLLYKQDKFILVKSTKDVSSITSVIEKLVNGWIELGMKYSIYSQSYAKKLIYL